MEETLDFKVELTANNVNKRKVADEIGNRVASTTGLDLSGMDPKYNMKIVLKVKGENKSGEGISIEDAIENATKGQKYDPTSVKLSAKCSVSVPYFVKSITERALNESLVYNQIDDVVKSLQKVYGARVVTQPHDTDYKITQTTKHYKKVVEKVPEKKVAGTGSSKKSFGDALSSVVKRGRIQSTIYEATYAYKIYGLESETGYAAPAVALASTVVATTEAPKNYSHTAKKDTGKKHSRPRKYAHGSTPGVMQDSMPTYSALI